MSDRHSQSLATRAIHGSSGKDAHGSPHTPIYNTTTFAFSSTADLLDVVDGKKPGSLYTRYGLNPSIFALKKPWPAWKAPKWPGLFAPVWPPKRRSS
jgi:cystathionine gamma-synthase